MKIVRMKTYDGIWETKVEVFITDADYRVRWPKYNLRGFIFRLLFKVVVHDERRGEGLIKEYKGMGNE